MASYNNGENNDERDLLTDAEARSPSLSHSGYKYDIVDDPLYREYFENEHDLMTHEELADFQRTRKQGCSRFIRTQVFINSCFKQTSFVDRSIVTTGAPKFSTANSGAPCAERNKCKSRITPSLLRSDTGRGVINYFPFSKHKVLKLCPSPMTNAQVRAMGTTNDKLAPERFDILIERLKSLISEMERFPEFRCSDLKSLNKLSRDASKRDQFLYRAMEETRHATTIRSFVSTVTRDVNLRVPIFLFAPVPRQEFQSFKISKFGREFYDVSYMTINQVEALIQLRANLITRNPVQYEYYSEQEIPYKFIWISQTWLQKSILHPRMQIWFNPLRLTLTEAFNLLYLDKPVTSRVDRTLFTLYESTSLLTSLPSNLELPDLHK